MTAFGQRQVESTHSGHWFARCLAFAHGLLAPVMGGDRRRTGAQVNSLWVVLQGLLVFAVGFGFHAYLAPYGVDPHHDGIMFKPALDVSQGKMVFRDTFTQYGGVTVLLQAAALKVFGAKLVVIKMQTAVTYGLGFLVFWRAWSRLIPTLLATLICLVGAVLGPDSIAEALPWSSVFAIFFQGLALLWTMRYFERGRELELVAAGGSAALAFWCRQPVGVFLAAGLLVALALIALRITPIYRRPPSGAWSSRVLFGNGPWSRVLGVGYLFGGGFVLVNAIILLWLAQYGALEHWWKQSIVLAKIWSAQTGQNHSLGFIISCLFPGGHLRVWCLLAVGVAIQAIRTGGPFLDPKSNPRGILGAQGMLAATVGVTSWLQYYPVACNYHCYWAGIPMLGIFVHLLYSTHISRSKVARSIVAIAVSGMVFYDDAKLRIDAVEPHIKGGDVPIRSVPALRGMYTSFAEARSYEALQKIIETYLSVRPDGAIVTALGDGLFPALTENQADYHPFYVNWSTITPLVYPDRREAYVKYIREHRPIVIGGREEGTNYVHVATLFFWSYPYYVNLPAELHPTEFVECNNVGNCQTRPLQ